jgi:hypothetical protein
LLADPRAPQVAPRREPLAHVLAVALVCRRFDLLRGFGGFQAERAALGAEEVSRFRFVFLEESAVLGWFQVGGFDLAAGFKLRGELIGGELVGAALGVYLGLPFGVGVEEPWLSGISTWE